MGSDVGWMGGAGSGAGPCSHLLLRNFSTEATSLFAVAGLGLWSDSTVPKIAQPQKKSKITSHSNARYSGTAAANNSILLLAAGNYDRYLLYYTNYQGNLRYSSNLKDHRASWQEKQSH